jgi:hypothetical protein
MVRKPVRKRAQLAAPEGRWARGPRIDASRLAMAAIERIRALLERTGHGDRMGIPATSRELEARRSLLDEERLPPSYAATLEIASAIGEPERLLNAAEMREARRTLAAEGGDDARLLPFCSSAGVLVCFDRKIRDRSGELGVVEYSGGATKFAAPSFGEWLDQVADEREENIVRAAAIPESLRELLNELGFTFDDPIIGRLETGDVDAIEDLLGKDRTAEVRSATNRLFDSSGKASLTLNLDEFTLAVSVRSGIYMFEAAEVFRWLRRFRDQDFFGAHGPRTGTIPDLRESGRWDEEADSVRDLRAAPPEPPLVQRGIVEVRGLPSSQLVFRAASGRSIDDFFVLGRTSSMRGKSYVIHVVRAVVREVHEVDAPLTDIYVTIDGTAWGLSHNGKAVRLAGGTAEIFPLKRPTPGRTAWFGIGAGGHRVLVWGAGTLLEFNGAQFVPFSPDAKLENSESIIGLAAGKRNITMLVVGDGVGAVARFDGKRWLPIDEAHVIDAPVLDLDVWQDLRLVLTRDGRILAHTEESELEEADLDRSAEALTFDNHPRSIHGLRAFDGGTLLASEGGVIAIGKADPVFYAAEGQSQPARISRVGNDSGFAGESGLVAMVGPHLWTWRDGALTVVDVRSV